MKNVAIAFNLIIALAFVAGCGPTAREKLITTTFTSITAIQKAEEAYSAQHQLDLVKSAPDADAAHLRVAQFLASRAPLDRAIEAATTAIAAAAALQDDPKSFDNLKTAAALVVTEAAKFLPGGGK